MAKLIEPVRKKNSEIKTLTGGSKSPVPTVPVKVLKETDGPVTWVQRAKRYYKAAIAAVGSTAAALVAAEGVPGLPDNVRGWFAGGFVALTVVGIILKKNEDWVDSL